MERHPFAVFNGAKEGWCTLLIERDHRVAVLSQALGNQVSAMNRIEVAAYDIQRLFFQDGEPFLLIEHHPISLILRLARGESVETFDVVTFEQRQRHNGEIQFRRPHWESITREEAERLLGSPLPADI